MPVIEFWRKSFTFSNSCGCLCLSSVLIRYVCVLGLFHLQVYLNSHLYFDNGKHYLFQPYPKQPSQLKCVV